MMPARFQPFSRRARRFSGLAALVFCFALGDAAPAAPLAAPAPAAENAPSMEAQTKRRSSVRRRRPRRPRGQQAPAAERIREIQAALAERGFYKRQPSGKWDAPSVEAMKKFQEASGLRPTGKINAVSLQKLSLGSEVAGQAPPRDTGSSAEAGPGSRP